MTQTATSFTQPADKRYFPNLNGLRFAGALAVMLFHCATLNREIWGSFYQNDIFRIYAFVMGKGHLGVMLFFVLSGFLITHLLLNENAQNGRIHLGNFLMRRLLRVWPLYFVIVVFGFFIFPHLPYGIVTVHELWRYMLFLSNIDEIMVGMKDSLNFLTATWTVSIEEQFYLTWGLLIGLFAFRKNRTYACFFVAIIVGSVYFHFLCHGESRVLYFHTFSVMSDLAIGGLIGLWGFSGGAAQLFGNMPRYAIVAIYVTGIGLILLEGPIMRSPLAPFERLIPASFFAFVILEQVYASRSFYKIDRIPGFYKAGELTYGFYLFHCICIYYWAIFFRQHQLTGSPVYYVLFVVSVFCSTYALAWLSYRYFEKPMLKLKTYFRK